MTTEQTMGRRLRVFRAERGLSQTDLADQIGTTQKTVTSWETGKALIPTRFLLKISQVYGVGLGYFDIVKKAAPAQ